MKTEMSYGARWQHKADLADAVNDYLHFYNTQCITNSLGELTIKEHRRMLVT